MKIYGKISIDGFSKWNVFFSQLAVSFCDKIPFLLSKNQQNLLLLSHIIDSPTDYGRPERK